MPRYRVLVEGSGLEAPTMRGAPIRGFFVTRFVNAPDEEAARHAALASVEKDWRVGKFARWNKSPAIAAVEVEEVPLVGWHLLKTREYIFHRGK